MKYDEMIRTFRKYGWEFEMPAGVEYKAMEDGTWRKRYTEWRNENYDVTIYPNEDEAVKAILQTVYFYANQCLVNNEIADLKPSAHAVERSRQVMDIFDKGVFRDVAPDTYHPEKHSSGKNSVEKDRLKLAKAAGLAAIGISAFLALRKKKKETDQPTSGILIHAERDSVCMGDDVMAPNAQDIRLREDTRVSELMKWVAGYVPAMKNYEWDIWCTNKMIGKLIS